MINRLSPEQLIRRTGERYVILAIALAQIIALVGALPGLISIRANAGIDVELFGTLNALMPFMVLVSHATAIFVIWQLTPTARKQLEAIKNGKRKADDKDEVNAWMEITGLPSRYGIVTLVVFFVIQVLPPYLIALSRSVAITSPLQSSPLNSPVPAYIFLGGIASILGSVMLATLLVERFTLPVRLMLLPKSFENQLKGRSGALLIGKFQILIFVLLMIAILLIAPIGYQQAVRSLYISTEPSGIFGALQLQSFLFGLIALTLGSAFTYLLFRTISDPIKELIKTFDKIEQGDLSQRAPVSATDELGIVTVQFNRMVSRLESLQNTLEQQVAERTKQLTILNEVGRVASSSLDPNELITRVINLFTDRFGYYYAAIYLLDPSEKWAELREATGDAGKVLKQNRHRLEVASRSMVGLAIREKAPRIAQVASEEKQRYENPLLPYTRSEIALPLIAGDRVLGALNVQSTKEADFGLQVVETMQSMAGQLTIALENARLFQDMQQNLREMRSIQQQYLLEAWNEFTTHNEELEYAVGDQSDSASHQIKMPISLRDQNIGQITLDGNEDWTPEQESLVGAVATQVAVALENARLVSESRQIAVRERMLAEINSKIWSSVTIEGVLQTVVKELGRRLDASRASIEIDVDGE